MNRKPDILVVLAALLGIGIMLSSLANVSAEEKQYQLSSFNQMNE